MSFDIRKFTLVSFVLVGTAVAIQESINYIDKIRQEHKQKEIYKRNNQNLDNMPRVNPFPLPTRDLEFGYHQILAYNSQARDFRA